MIEPHPKSQGRSTDKSRITAPSIDIYLTYRCNLRCSHCFVGDRLNSARDFDPDLLDHLLRACVAWQTKEITLLGGEPTLYPGVRKAIESAQNLGMQVRLVTNGLDGLRRLVSQLQGPQKLAIGFSIDGSNPASHDGVRGKGSFVRMLANIAICKQQGLPVFAVTSIGQHNVDDALAIVKLSGRLEMSYLNIHYVVPVGFAGPGMALSPERWRTACLLIGQEAERIGVEVRIEELMRRDSGQADQCMVRSESNLMFLPDGRVFRCPLFLDQPDAHSYLWTLSGLVRNVSVSSEKAICHKDPNIACPALPLVSEDLAAAFEGGHFRLGCVLNKSIYGIQDA